MSGACSSPSLLLHSAASEAVLRPSAARHGFLNAPKHLLSLAFTIHSHGCSLQDTEEREVVVYPERPMQLSLTPSAVTRADALHYSLSAERFSSGLITADLLGSAEKGAR